MDFFNILKNQKNTIDAQRRMLALYEDLKDIHTDKIKEHADYIRWLETESDEYQNIISRLKSGQGIAPNNVVQLTLVENPNTPQ